MDARHCQSRSNQQYSGPKIVFNSEFSNLKVRFCFRWNWAIPEGAYWAEKGCPKPCFIAHFCLKKPFDHFRIDDDHHKIVKFEIFQNLSLIFRFREIRRFQGAFMGLKKSNETGFTVELPLKNGIFWSKKLIKVKEKSQLSKVPGVWFELWYC